MFNGASSTIDQSSAGHEELSTITQKSGLRFCEVIHDLENSYVHRRFLVGVHATIMVDNRVYRISNMEALKTSLGNIGTSVQTATVSTSKVLSGAVNIGAKGAEGGVKIAGEALDAGLLIGSDAVKASGQIAQAAVAGTGDVAKTTLQTASSVASTAIKETGDITNVTTQAVSNNLQWGVKMVSNLTGNVFVGIDNINSIVSGSGANVASKILTTQAATASRIEAQAPEKIRRELQGVFDKVAKDLQTTLRGVDAIQKTNLRAQIGVFQNIFCYGTSGFFKRYFSTYKCPRQRPDNTSSRDMSEASAYSQQYFMRLDSLSNTTRSALATATGDMQATYKTIVEDYMKKVSTMVDDLNRKYTSLIEKYSKQIDAFFNSPPTGGRRQTKRKRRGSRGYRVGKRGSGY